MHYVKFGADWTMFTSYNNFHIYGKTSMAAKRKHKACNFLLPVGDSMTLT